MEWSLNSAPHRLLLATYNQQPARPTGQGGILSATVRPVDIVLRDETIKHFEHGGSKDGTDPGRRWYPNHESQTVRICYSQEARPGRQVNKNGRDVARTTARSVHLMGNGISKQPHVAMSYDWCYNIISSCSSSYIEDRVISQLKG